MSDLIGVSEEYLYSPEKINVLDNPGDDALKVWINLKSNPKLITPRTILLNPISRVKFNYQK
jgi:hypothetical protein